MSRRTILLVTLASFLPVILATATAASVHPSYSSDLPVDTVPFYPNGTYDETVAKPNDYLAHPIGQWPLRYHELERYLEALAASSERVVVEKHGLTYEGRDQNNIVVGLPETIRNLEDIKARSARLASHGAFGSDSELDGFIGTLPATAWLGYSIHGDEVSGVDAAAQLAYQLAAGTDSATLHLLENLLIIIDPSQNPDGRERYMSMLETYKSNVPNYDRFAQQHGGVWPWGRGNHYLFDMNRDWILMTQQETEGRVRTVLEWNPQLVVDAHEMGSNDNYLFSPPRQPINYNTTENVHKWWEVFSREQGEAFDRRGWPYYVKEWHEHWFPGYASGWPCFFGVIGILYEQAGVDGSAVMQRSNYLLTYHEAVNHQFTSSLANLHSLANNRRAIMRDYYRTRQDIVADGKRTGLAYLFVPDGDEIKMNRFITSLLKQGIQVERATREFSVRSAADIYKKEHPSKKFPAGTYIVRTGQLHGNLVKAICEFDPHLKLEFLKEERRELEKEGDTRMYETSAWSVPMGYDLDAYETTTLFDVSADPVTEVNVSGGKLHNPDTQFGFVINFEGEKTYLAMNRLFANNLVVHASEKPFTLEGNKFNAGALVLRKRGNSEEMVSILESLAGEVGINVYGVNTGMSSEGSYLGAGTFRLLTRPEIAVVTGEPLSGSSFGALWYTIDKELELPHSLIRILSLPFTDISRYNVIVFPSSWGGSLGEVLGKHGSEKLKKWVQNGGTLVCVGNSAVWAADSSTGLSGVRLKRQVLDKLDKYAKQLEREVQAEAPEVDTMALWHPEKVTAKKEEEEKAPPAGKEEAKDLDEWQRRFFPRGVIMRADIDTEDWLAFGMKKTVPVVLYTDYAFMSGEHVGTVARLCTDENKLRLSGLLWPEARQRWVGTAYATRERMGRGQIILFAGHPNTRAYFHGTRKMFVNAVLYGPGMGSWFEGPYDEK
ncbi:MAG: hypothetical protein JSW34_09005 [Candidatus Zixiibacteriota bacterium]|nr:MAG: hypothetical protein JSW34_09005 [candidate division Zixibacteria bacterium]